MRKLPAGYWLFLTALAGYTVFSFTQVDINLILSSQPVYLAVQQAWWRLGLEHRQLTALIYGGLIVLAFAGYLQVIKAAAGFALTKKRVFQLLLPPVLILFASYPALSHDIFNYVFNAKMVLTYHANPHTTAAWNFPEDPWLKYMHNIHTPAPYGIGWTIVSLIPGFLGQNHLKLTILAFRAIVTLAFLGVVWCQLKLSDRSRYRWVLAFGLNPLVLIESISSIHNDVVMMALVLLAWLLAKNGWRGRNILLLGLAGLSFGLSVIIKYASLMFAAGWIVYEAVKRVKVKFSFGGVQALCHFALLLTERSKRFLPWYLIWPLTYLPWIKETFLQKLLLVFSASSLLSYLPYLLTGEYSDQQLHLRQGITFALPLIWAAAEWARLRWSGRHHA